MYGDSEELLSQCNKYDLIIKMYIALGRWINAIEICEKYDRVNLNSIYYKYATYLKESGKIENAIEYYEKCDCKIQIIQMLYKYKKIKLLQNYISNNNSNKLYKWYAQYLESNNDIENALIYYEKSKDYVSMVRLFINNAIYIIKNRNYIRMH